MPGRPPLLAILALGLLGFASCRRSATLAPTTLPTVEVTLDNEPLEALFERPPTGKNKRYVAVTFRDVDGLARRAKVALRGFSAWHHGRTKPSLRVKPKGRANGLPEFVELSRPEDPLALCNWLPDQLAHELGLLHERSQPVRMVIDGSRRGVYLRSLRPGDDLCAAAGRPRGTWWKGDSLGARRHLDLWAGSASWRSIGADDPRATRALDEMLAALREPASPESWDRLAAVLDLEAAAKVSALAALVGSIHADAFHNHVLFYDPARDRLEPMLWDANGFGVHAEPSLAVDVMRHPLAARLSCHPEFVHRRNEILWALMHGSGGAEELIASADALLEHLDPVLQEDPEIARLVLRRGVFEVDPLDYERLPEARAAFADFVRERHACLRDHFSCAAIAIDPVPGHSGRSQVTVFGSVAVALSRTDGAAVVSVTGRDASLLWPGLSSELTDVRQHRQADGRGVSAPFAERAAMRYLVDCPPDLLIARNAFTERFVKRTAEPPPAVATRSLKPWSFAQHSPIEITLGPGTVHVTEPLAVASDTILRIAAGTDLHLAAGIRCFGRLVANGTPQQPIEIHCDGAGITCVGGSVEMTHVRVADTAKWNSLDGAPQAMLSLRDCRTRIHSSQFARASGIAIAVVAGNAQIADSIVSRCHGTALAATSGAQVQLTNTDLLFARRGIVSQDDARVLWNTGTLRGHRIGVIAGQTAPPFAGGKVRLENVTCLDAGLFDLDPRIAGEIQLLSTDATSNPRAAGRITRGATRAITPATPR